MQSLTTRRFELPVNSIPVTSCHLDGQEEIDPGVTKLPPFTLRVRGGKAPTNPADLSLSILHALDENTDAWVKVMCVGSPALSIACTAFQLAAQKIEKTEHGIVLVNRQSVYTANIGGKPAKGVCLRIFPIPAKDAL